MFGKTSWKTNEVETWWIPKGKLSDWFCLIYWALGRFSRQTNYDVFQLFTKHQKIIFHAGLDFHHLQRYPSLIKFDFICNYSKLSTLFWLDMKWFLVTISWVDYRLTRATQMSWSWIVVICLLLCTFVAMDASSNWVHGAALKNMFGAYKCIYVCYSPLSQHVRSS